jgi:hypothetical protein
MRPHFVIGTAKRAPPVLKSPIPKSSARRRRSLWRSVPDPFVSRHRMMLALVCFDHCNQNLKTLAIGRSGRRLKDAIDFGERHVVVGLRLETLKSCPCPSNSHGIVGQASWPSSYDTHLVRQLLQGAARSACRSTPGRGRPLQPSSAGDDRSKILSEGQANSPNQRAANHDGRKSSVSIPWRKDADLARDRRAAVSASPKRLRSNALRMIRRSISSSMSSLTSSIPSCSFCPPLERRCHV